MKYQILVCLGLTFVGSVFGQYGKIIDNYDFNNYSGYILTVNTTATRNVIGSTLNDYHEIREKCDKCRVTYICSEDGIAKKDQDWYVTNVLRHKQDSDINTQVIFSDSLYKVFQNHQGMEQIIYIENGRIIFGETLKHFSLKSNSLLFEDVGIKLIASLKVPDEIHASVVDVIRKNDDESLLYLSDLDESVYKLNLSSGEIISSYTASEDDGINFYCTVVADNYQKCNYAQENREKLKRLNRSELYFSDVRSYDGKIFISTMLQVHEILEKDFVYINELGIVDTLKRGSLFANGYSVLVELNSDLEKVTSLFLDDIGSANYNFAAGSDFCFLPVEKGSIVLNLPKDMIGPEDPIFSFFHLKNKNTLEFSNYYAPLYPESADEKLYELEYGGLISLNDGFYGYVDVLPYIYDLKTAIPKYTLEFEDEKLVCDSQYAQYYEERENSLAKYKILALGELANSLIGVIYSYCDEFVMLDILSQNFELKQRIKVSEYITFDPWLESIGSNIVINQNKIIFLTKEEGDFYLKFLEID